MIHLFLFDVDGVLVDARGYLKALQDTVTRFSKEMGLGDQAPTEEEVRLFEANGLTSEWDSGAACVAALLVERLRREPSLLLPPHWPETLSYLARHPCPLPHPDYATLAQKVGQRLQEIQIPAEAARAVLWDVVLAIPDLEAARSAVAVLLETLLGHTHDFYRAPVTRRFQHLAIGSAAVAETYAVQPDFESLAYLEHFDRPLMDPKVRCRLERAATKGGIRVALYTARPSLPPAEVGEPATGYSPEAEMAQAIVDMDKWPLIGMGRMRWLADRAGEKVQLLVKPSPVQALAALGAAWAGREAAALEAALALHRDGDLRSPLADLPPTTAHVFEDVPGGLEAVRDGVRALQAAGVTIIWQPYGIAPAHGPKAAAMAARNIPVYPSVNEALLAALASI